MNAAVMSVGGVVFFCPYTGVLLPYTQSVNVSNGASGT